MIDEIKDNVNVQESLLCLAYSLKYAPLSFFFLSAAKLKSIQVIVLKLHIMIVDIKEKCSVQEP